MPKFPSVKVPHGAAGIVFTTKPGEREPLVLLAMRHSDLGRWPGKLQLGPAGRVEEPVAIRLMRAARRVTPARALIDRLDLFLLKAAEWRELFMGARDILRKRTVSLMIESGASEKAVERFMNAARALAGSMRVLPERPVSAVRREGTEELGIRRNNILSITPFHEVFPLSEKQGDPRNLHVSFFLIHVTPREAQRIVDKGGSKELVGLRLASLSEVEAIKGQDFQPHYAQVIDVLRQAINRVVAEKRG